jgi:hypothetical protein
MGKGILVRFCRGTNDVTLCGNFQQDIYLYTESRDTPIMNYCKMCNRPYFRITNLSSSSAIKDELKVAKCSHSSNVNVYVRDLTSVI